MTSSIQNPEFDRIINKLKNKEDLPISDVNRVMSEIMSGNASDENIEIFLELLREKGASSEEIIAALSVMKANAVKITAKHAGLLDTCGTGGDAKNTLNVSTISALVASSAGIKVAKHGNRSVSSSCGSADLLEMLGVTIDLSVPAIERMLDEVDFGFLFAPKFHPATRHAMAARKKIGGKTIFNLLGPLSNPAGADRQVVGVYDEKLVELLARVLAGLGRKRALVVCGADGLDEISISVETKAAEIDEGKVRVFKIKPEDFGVARAALSDIQCASKEEAKKKALSVLKGEPGPAKDIVCMNAAAAIYIGGKATSLKEGFEMAKKLLESGAVLKKLMQIIELSNKLKNL